MTTINPQDVAALVKFQQESAAYFEARDTGGEDRAHWANVFNAENCRKTADTIEALMRECERLEIDKQELVRSQVSALTVMHERAEKAEAERDSLATQLHAASNLEAASLARAQDAEAERDALAAKLKQQRTFTAQCRDHVETAEAKLQKMEAVVEAARKAVPVMRALGWQIAAACDQGDDIDASIEAQAATECYQAITDALSTLDGDKQ